MNAKRLFLISLLTLPCHAVIRAEEVSTVSVSVEEGKVVSGPVVVKLKRGDTVSIRIQSDKADEVHVHGLDLHALVKPGQPTTLQIVGRRTGRFTFELHGSGLELGAIEIYPR